MKLLIAGSRTFEDYTTLSTAVHVYTLFDLSIITEIISGTAKGADRLGEQFAAEFDIPVNRFPADWNKHGKAAGPIRNELMAQACTNAILFWDGKSRGTHNMKTMLTKYNKPFNTYTY